MKRIILLLVLFLALSPMAAMGAEFFDTESSAISAFIRTKTQETDIECLNLVGVSRGLNFKKFRQT